MAQSRPLQLKDIALTQEQDTARSGPQGLVARIGALELICDVLDRGRMLEGAQGGVGSGPERAESKALADLTLRRLGQVDAVLAPLVARPPRAPVNHVLRLMAAELLFAGTAPHAAVDLGVRLVKRLPGAERLSGLVNAVGRKLAAAGQGALAGQDAAMLNLAPWLRARLEADWGPVITRAMAEAHLTPAPHDLTPRSPGDAAVLAAELGARLLPSGSLRLAGRPQLSALPGYDAGAWWVQDAAASLPARMLAAKPGERVLDACAAPGGKTLQLASAGAVVTAMDRIEARLPRLRENLARTGLSAEVLCADAADWSAPEPFDAVLLDAPCSATGTLRRHPEAAWLRTPEHIRRYATGQARLLAACARMLRPGGRLVYAVCSLELEEGEAIVAGAAGLGLAPDPISADDLPELAEAITPQGFVRTFPFHLAADGGMDGFFIARFRRG